MPTSTRENMAEYYYAQLKSTTNPGNLLARFFAYVHKMPHATKKEIIMFNRLLRLFSRFLIYFVILRTAETNFSEIREPYPYLLAVCRERFEKTHNNTGTPHTVDLTRMINQLSKEKEKDRNITVPDDVLED